MRIARAANIYAASSHNEELRFLIPSMADHTWTSLGLPGLPKVHACGKDRRPIANDHIFAVRLRRVAT